MLDTSPPLIPISGVADEKTNKHTWIHFLYVNLAKARGVTRINIFVGILAFIGVIRQRGPCMVWVKIKEIVALCANEIM